MTSLDNLIVMNPNRRADEGLKRILNDNRSRIYVCDSSNDNHSCEKSTDGVMDVRDKITHQKTNLFGIISKTDLLSMASERKDIQKQ